MNAIAVSTQDQLRKVQPEVQWQVTELAEVSSTMDVAREKLSQVSADSPAVVLARRQTHGRGRQGRTWVSTSGSFAATFVFAAERPLANFSGFSLAVGCILKDTFHALGAEVGLKWPNDVLSLDGRKLAGVLIELVPKNDRTFVLIGIGINLFDAPSEVPTSTALYNLSGYRYEAGAVLNQLAPELWRGWNQFLLGGFKAFRDRWLAAAVLNGKELRFDTGASIVRGRMSGVDEQGALLLDHDGTQIVVTAGHQLDDDYRN